MTAQARLSVATVQRLAGFARARLPTITNGEDEAIRPFDWGEYLEWAEALRAGLTAREVVQCTVTAADFELPAAGALPFAAATAIPAEAASDAGAEAKAAAERAIEQWHDDCTRERLAGRDHVG